MSPPRRPTNEVMVLLGLLRDLATVTKNHSKVLDVNNQTLAAMAQAISALNRTLIAIGRVAQEVAGVDIQARTEIAKEDRRSELLHNVVEGLFETLSGKSKARRKSR